MGLAGELGRPRLYDRRGNLRQLEDLQLRQDFHGLDAVLLSYHRPVKDESLPIVLSISPIAPGTHIPVSNSR